MAITTTTITKNAGWARTDVIDQLEEAFTWLELHGTQISGLVTSISAYSGGGTVGSSGTNYYDVPVATTTGIGTGASFDVDRSGGSIQLVNVNRPGYGYTTGEYVTLSAEDIGGSVNGATGIGITVNIGAVGYGSTNQFFDKNFTPSDTNRPWGVLKQDFDTTKRFGVTYRGFKVYSDSNIHGYVGSSFFPFNTTNDNDKGGQVRDSFRGTVFLDVTSTSFDELNTLDSSTQFDSNFQFATTNSPTTHDLKLNIYRSGIDPSFAVLSYNQPSVTGKINDSTFSTFIIHNFNSNLWDLNEVFSAGITFIDKDPSLSSLSGNTSFIGFKTILSGNSTSDYVNVATRTAEAGWIQIYDNAHYGHTGQNYIIASTKTNYTNSVSGSSDSYEYFPSMPATIYSRTGGIKDRGYLNSTPTYGNRYPITTYNSIIKGIPINGNLIPCPYYMPDDFVVIDFNIPISAQEIKQGDTITLSGSEVYTVITGSYNQSNETAGILFCARTV